MNSSGPTVHVLRVSLRDVEPQVWRRLVVRSEMPLSTLNYALEVVMGWDGDHVHMFDTGETLFGERHENAGYLTDERSATVCAVLPRVGASLRWDYDFGDGWQHDVVVEAIEPQVAGHRYPMCLDGARACPPEDCGGPPGYAHLLAVLVDPKHREHDEMLEWTGDEFDPEVFDLMLANRMLRGR